MKKIYMLVIVVTIVSALFSTGCSVKELRENNDEAKEEAKRLEEEYASECQSVLSKEFGNDAQIQSIHSLLVDVRDSTFSLPMGSKVSDWIEIEYLKSGKKYCAKYNIQSKEMFSNENENNIKADIEKMFSAYILVNEISILNSALDNKLYTSDETGFDSLGKDEDYWFLIYTNDDLEKIPISVIENINEKMGNSWNMVIIQTESEKELPKIEDMCLAYDSVPVYYDGNGNSENAFKKKGILKTIDIDDGFVNILDVDKGRIYHTSSK